MDRYVNDDHYCKYITSRFLVSRDGDEAKVMDKELGLEKDISCGCNLADGTLKFEEDGVVFIPPLSSIHPFALRDAREESPLHYDEKEKRGHFDEVLRHENQKSLELYGDEDRAIIELAIITKK